MTDTGISGWVKYLKHPLVLVGFVFALAAGIIEALLKQEIVNTLGDAAAPIITKSIYLLFALGAIIVILAIVVQRRNIKRETSEKANKIKQKTTGDQSPAVVSKGDKSSVSINYNSSSDSK